MPFDRTLRSIDHGMPPVLSRLVPASKAPVVLVRATASELLRASLCQLAPHGLVWSTTCHTLRVVVTPSMPHRCALCHACGPNIPIEYSVRATASELLRFLILR